MHMDINKSKLILLPPFEYVRAKTGNTVYYANRYWLATSDGFIAFCLTGRSYRPAAQCNDSKGAMEGLLLHINYPVKLEVKKINTVFFPPYENEIDWLKLRKKYTVAALESVTPNELSIMRKYLVGTGSPDMSSTQEIVDCIVGMHGSNQEIAALVNDAKMKNTDDRWSMILRKVQSEQLSHMHM